MTDPKNIDKGISEEQQKQKERQTGGRQIYPEGVDVGQGKENAQPQADKQAERTSPRVNGEGRSIE